MLELPKKVADGQVAVQGLGMVPGYFGGKLAADGAHQLLINAGPNYGYGVDVAVRAIGSGAVAILAAWGAEHVPEGHARSLVEGVAAGAAAQIIIDLLTRNPWGWQPMQARVMAPTPCELGITNQWPCRTESVPLQAQIRGGGLPAPYFPGAEPLRAATIRDTGPPPTRTATGVVQVSTMEPRTWVQETVGAQLDRVAPRVFVS